jgi:DNA-binding MarR family transcriptional regulator
MSSVTTSDGSARQHRRLTVTVKESLRDLGTQLTLLNRRVGTRVDAKDVDWSCLEIVTRNGPLTPSALAKLAGLHPATMTGVLNRLERDGWISRERDPADRRAVMVSARRDRAAEVFRLYAGMNAAMDELCAGYTEAELDLIAGFLRRATDAGRSAAETLPGKEG